MRDVSIKQSTLRTARATAVLAVSPETIEAVRTGNVPKADPLGVARVAGIQAAKNTSLLIPYCHQVPLDYAGVTIALEDSRIVIDTEVKAIWKTGVEMEALVAASTSALTLYDMLKIIDDRMEIQSVRLLEKKGGKSGSRDSAEGLTAAVLVMSDSVSRGEKEDFSGKLLVERLRGIGFKVSILKIVPDDSPRIVNELKGLSGDDGVDLLVTTGGTGAGPRDVTPEATLSVLERRLEGVEEALRTYGGDRIPTAMLSRGVAGIRGKTVIVNLPGSRGGAEDGIHAIFPGILHVFRMMRGGGH
jgi:molybdenum cofactor biosynthesis protein MoaC